MTKEYIERDAATQVIQGTSVFAFSRTSVIEMLNDLPAADVVEVVRCRDCIGKETWYTADGGSHICGLSGLSPVEDHDYCSLGERRDDHCGAKMEGGAGNVCDHTEAG